MSRAKDASDWMYARLTKERQDAFETVETNLNKVYDKCVENKIKNEELEDWLQEYLKKEGGRGEGPTRELATWLGENFDRGVILRMRAKVWGVEIVDVPPEWLEAGSPAVFMGAEEEQAAARAEEEEVPEAPEAPKVPDAPKAAGPKTSKKEERRKALAGVLDEI